MWKEESGQTNNIVMIILIVYNITRVCTKTRLNTYGTQVRSPTKFLRTMQNTRNWESENIWTILLFYTQQSIYNNYATCTAMCVVLPLEHGNTCFQSLHSQLIATVYIFTQTMTYSILWILPAVCNETHVPG